MHAGRPHAATHQMFQVAAFVQLETSIAWQHVVLQSARVCCKPDKGELTEPCTPCGDRCTPCQAAEAN